MDDAKQTTGPQAEELERFTARVSELLAAEAPVLAKILMDCPDQQMFGPPEFALRDALHAAGAKVLGAALSERKKRGTWGRPAIVRSAPMSRVSKSIARSS